LLVGINIRLELSTVYKLTKLACHGLSWRKIYSDERCYFTHTMIAFHNHLFHYVILSDLDTVWQYSETTRCTTVIYIYIYICCQTVTTYLLGFMIFAFVLSFPCCMSPKPVRKLAPILYDTKLCQMNNYKLTLNKINVGELVVDLSLRKAIVGCKCICKIKTRSDGLLRIIKTSTYSERFKSWVYDINYEETFALLLILLPHYEVLAGCCCCQIVSIISYGCQELMSSSKGIFQNNCIYPSSSRHDHLLEKVYHFIELYIYDLKQDSHVWFEKYHSTTSHFGFASHTCYLCYVLII
jgi:hypothetical protein